MSDSLRGKSAIVTGGGSGINLAFVVRLLESGVNVLIGDLALRPESQAVIDKYHDEPKALFQKTDVTSWKELSDLFQRAEEAFGTVDIVCPGAGIFEPPFSSFWYPPGGKESKDDPFGDRYKSIDVNLTHPIRMTQLAISHFLSSTIAVNPANTKTVVHIASTASQAASLPFPLYHAVKWGLAGFIRSLADMEDHFKIRVAGVAPGAVQTPLWTESADKMVWVTNENQAQSWITPDQVAECMMNIVTGTQMHGPDGTPIHMKGGLLIEVGAEHVREIPLYNNPGPDPADASMKVANAADGYGKVLGLLKNHRWG